jgi:type IV secretory pathway VirB10-like protein
MSMHKSAHPGDDGFETPERENGGRFNKKNLLMAGGAVVALFVVGYSIAGITQERPEKDEPKGLAPAQFTAQAPEPTLRREEPAADPEPAATPTQEPRRERIKETRTSGREERKEKWKPPTNFKVSVLTFGNSHMQPVMAPLLQGNGMAADSAAGGRAGVSQAKAQGTGQGGGNANKGDFYTGGGGRSGQGLYHPHSVQPELEGCVLKAGEEIIIQNPNPVRTELPGQVRGVVVEPAYGWVFLGNGQTEECLAVPAGSTVMTEVNSGGVSRGDMRVQMCATRIDLKGGGIMPMSCSPALGQDGASGVEAESDYQWGGIATGILIEAALSTVGALGGLIEGPAGVAVNVGSQGIRGVGSEYVNRELMRPPVLTMTRGAIYRIQVNSDIAFPGE